MKSKIREEDLTEALGVYLENEENEEKENDDRFKVTDTSSANWVLRKLRAVNEKIREVEKTAEEEIYYIERWKEKELDNLDRSVKYFEGLLEEFFQENRKEDPKFKFKSPYGYISSRKQRPKWNYLDEEKIIQYLKESGKENLIRIKEDINKKDFKDFVEVVGENVINKETGEVIPAIKIEEREDKTIIKVEE